MSRLYEHARSDEGLTLIEMMISLGILMLIIVPVTTSFILSLLQSTSSQERVADSSGAQVISSYLLTDIQSSKTVTLGHAAPGCQPNAGDNVELQLDWVDPETPSTSYSVSYLWRTVGNQNQLYRAECKTSGSPASTTTKETLLALNLENGGSGFTPSCANADGTANPTCADPAKVKVDVVAHSVKPSTDSGYEPFAFSFEARRRVG